MGRRSAVSTFLPAALHDTVERRKGLDQAWGPRLQAAQLPPVSPGALRPAHAAQRLRELSRPNGWRLRHARGRAQRATPAMQRHIRRRGGLAPQPPQYASCALRAANMPAGAYSAGATAGGAGASCRNQRHNPFCPNRKFKRCAHLHPQKGAGRQKHERYETGQGPELRLNAEAWHCQNDSAKMATSVPPAHNNTAYGNAAGEGLMHQVCPSQCPKAQAGQDKTDDHRARDQGCYAMRTRPGDWTGTRMRAAYSCSLGLLDRKLHVYERISATRVSYLTSHLIYASRTWFKASLCKHTQVCLEGHRLSDPFRFRHFHVTETAT